MDQWETREHQLGCDLEVGQLCRYRNMGEESHMCVVDIQPRRAGEKLCAWVVDKKSNNSEGRPGKA
jgi:hypothetical protein